MPPVPARVARPDFPARDLGPQVTVGQEPAAGGAQLAAGLAGDPAAGEDNFGVRGGLAERGEKRPGHSGRISVDQTEDKIAGGGGHEWREE